MSRQSSALPTEWVEHLFARFSAMYGSQKLAAMWADADIGRVKATWRQALGRYQAATIGAALRGLEDGGGAWPPTLPEFVELCRQASLARELATTPGQLGIGHDAGAATTPERARANVAKVDAMVGAANHAARHDPLLWARRPKSAQAVLLLVRGAAGDHRLREILAAHRANGGADCRSAAPRAAIRALGALASEEGVHDQDVAGRKGVLEEVLA